MAKVKIKPHLWYTKDADKAAEFYASIFPDSRVDRVSVMPGDSPSGPEGSVKLVEFTLFGQPFMAITAGPMDPFNHAISLLISCDTQDEIDRYSAALAEGGTPEPCGWIKDKYGVAWQVHASILDDMLTDQDRERARRVASAMMKMKKFDIAALKRAYEG